MLFVLLLSCVQCEDFDPGAGLLDCDTVQLCTRGHETWYETADGTEYDCLADGQACGDLLCDVCRLDEYTRLYTCGG